MKNAEGYGNCMQVMEQNPDYELTPLQIAAREGVHVNTVYHWIKIGLKYRKHGRGRYRIWDSDLREFLADEQHALDEREEK